MLTLDSGIAIHSYTGIQMSISWTLGLQSITQISTNKHLLWGTSTTTFEYPCPELAPLSTLGHINSHIQISMSRTSPFICFGAHQQPYSTILTLVTIPDASFSESKVRCKLGHETQKRGTTSSWANSPAILAFLQKGGLGWVGSRPRLVAYPRSAPPSLRDPTRRPYPGVRSQGLPDC